MIGLALHLAAVTLDDARATVRDLGWAATSAARLALAARLDPEAARAVGEVAALRAERDLARLEHAAAVEVCDELKELLATARKEREEWKQNAVNTAQDALRFAEEHHKTRADLEALRAAVRRHLAADTLDQAEPAWRALEALLPEVKP